MDEQNINAGVLSRDAGQNDVLRLVVEAITAVLGISISDVRPDSVLLNLGAQSIDFVELVFRLEKRFGIDIPQAYMMPDLHTVDTYVRAVEHGLAPRVDGMSIHSTQQ